HWADRNRLLSLPMNDQDAVPPDIPFYAHPDAAGRAESFTEDGARWRWTGSTWRLIDAPGTHAEVIHFQRVLLPLMDHVIAIARTTTNREEAVDQIWSMEGCNPSTLEKLRVLLGSSDDLLHRTASKLVVAALQRTEG